MFPDDKTAEQWFVAKRWPNGVTCPHCNSDNVHLSEHPTMPYHCRPCRRRFSVRVGTLMASSKIGYRKWVLAIFRMSTSLKGVSSRKQRRDLGITQRSYWHLAHRIRQTWEKGKKHADKRLREGPGTAGETAVFRGERSPVWRHSEDLAVTLAERQEKTATPSTPPTRDIPERIASVERLAESVERLAELFLEDSRGYAQRLQELEASLRLLSERVDAIEPLGKGR